MIDGCTTTQSLIQIILPVMMMSTGSKITVPVALNYFISKAGISWDVMSAGIVVALLPIMVIFGFSQKYIIADLTESSVKG